MRTDVKKNRESLACFFVIIIASKDELSWPVGWL